MSGGQVHVWLVRWEGLAEEAAVDAWEEFLDAGERDRCRRLGPGDARRQYVAGHGLVRQTLSRYADVEARAWRFAPGPHGKPQIAQPAEAEWLGFNLSHTHGLAACAVAAGLEVGVDVERVDSGEAIEEAAELFLAPSERADCAGLAGAARTRRLYEYWTLKEACTKALGVGLALPPASVAFGFDARGGIRVRVEGGQADEGWRFALSAPTSRHRLATAVRARGFQGVTIIERPVELATVAGLQVEVLA